jgi:hypothetical protein
MQQGASVQGQSWSGLDLSLDLSLAERHLRISRQLLAAGLVAEVRGNVVEGLLLSAIAAKHSGIALAARLKELAP